MSQSKAEKYSSGEWDFLRERFSLSALGDTELAILGQHSGFSWPFKGSDETPAKYIEYSLEELQSVPGLVGKKSRIRLLMDILRETLAFDDPFAVMVDSVEAGSREDRTYERILEQLNIQQDYPAKFVFFSEPSNRLIRSAHLETLLEVIHYAQELPVDVPEGADLKVFINSLSHKDEVGISAHLPYRRSERSLHLAEAIGLIAAQLPLWAQLELLNRSGLALTEEEKAALGNTHEGDFDTLLSSAIEAVEGVCQWFPAEAEDLRQTLHTTDSAERYFIPINDPRRERVAAMLAKAHFGLGVHQKKGLMSKLSGLFGH